MLFDVSAPVILVRAALVGRICPQHTPPSSVPTASSRLWRGRLPSHRGPAYTFRRLLRSCRRSRGLNTWWTGRATVLRRGPARNILDQALVTRFHQEHPDQPTKTGRIPQPRGRPPRPPPLLDPLDDSSDDDNVSFRDPSSELGRRRWRSLKNISPPSDPLLPPDSAWGGFCFVCFSLFRTSGAVP